MEVEEIVEAGNHVVVVGRSQGERPTFDVRAVHVWKLRDGKLLRLDAYLDTPAMVETLAQ